MTSPTSALKWITYMQSRPPPEREAFRREAYAYYMGQIICEARKNEKITQKELAERIGAEQSYISKIEKGLIEPSIGTFYRIINALGLRVEIVKPLFRCSKRKFLKNNGRFYLPLFFSLKILTSFVGVV
jgi:transcriptional regulator with XRE-family HTH domain